MSQEVIKKFDLVRNTVLESNANNKERIADKITELGLTLSWLVYLGAVPWVASKMAWPES